MGIFVVNFEDFGKFLLNFEKMFFLTDEKCELCSVAEIANKTKSKRVAKILLEIASSNKAEALEKLDKICGWQISFETLLLDEVL